MRLNDNDFYKREEPPVRQLTVRLKTDLYEELKIVSQQIGMTITAVLILAIWKSVLGR
jgi:hypothetical protein